MGDMLARGATWLERTRARHAAQEVYFLRGGSALRVRATRGRSLFEVDDGSGALVRVETADFLILAAELLVDGLAAEPKAGDRIVTGELDDGEAFEVRPPAAGQPAWRWSDVFRLTYRVHARYVGRHPGQTT